ncbi:hypothetical protein [Nocardia jejuensis]|uniref:hypothetical protein n=1 Tax=Nocardia jejuensis TaxID=328049 RepID=UPI000830EB23|nr:hypothetical protein [Nocardia jejuensis]
MTAARQTTLNHEQSEFSAARAAEKIACEKQNVMAAHTVAGHALDAQDCAYLLEMLGLDAAGREE